MQQFPFIQLPEYFTTMLKSNMQSRGMVYYHFIQNNPELFQLSQNFLKIEKKPGQMLSDALKSMGWPLFRDQLAHVLLHFNLYGEYPMASVQNCRLSQDLAHFEQTTADYATGGYSRSYLLAFYLKMVDYLLKRERREVVEEYSSLIDESLIDLLSYSNIKITKIDWVLLILTHFDHYLQRDYLSTLLEKKTRFSEIYNDLSKEQKNHMMSNLITYGYAISEVDMFSTIFV